MALTDDLISQFVKITKDDTKTKGETTVYGTLVEQGNKQFVRIDGSELLTPISATVDAKPGERVVVMIKNHAAVVTGNASSPSARTGDVQSMGKDISDLYDEFSTFEIVVAGLVTADEMQVERGRIDILVSENVTIKERLTASEGSIDILEANYVSVNKSLTANNAAIENLEATKLDVTIANAQYASISSLDAVDARVYNLESTYGEFVDLSASRLTAIEATINGLDTNYANIDFSNIGQAAMEYFYSKSGLIEDVTVGDSTITGKLVGVTISGDLIIGNTIKAEKLVIKGSDGLYYKLNTDGMKTEAQQTDENSINGSVIKAKSITASKISVTDLVAFGATIGGFNITENSLYSGVKSSVGNTTRGVYLDKDGQLAVGDTASFIKYYKDAEGKYRVAISADEIKFSNGAVVNDLMSHVKVTYDANGSPILNLVSGNNAIQLMVTNTGVSIYENGTMSTYISNRMLNVDRVYATKESQVGPFVTAERANGNVGTRWTGGGNG